MAAISTSTRPTSLSQPLSTVTTSASSNFASNREVRRDHLNPSIRFSTASLSVPQLHVLAGTSASASASASAASAASLPQAGLSAPAAPPSPSFGSSSARGHHLSTPSTSSFSAPALNRGSRSSSLLALAAAAIDRTQSAIASAEQKIRPRQSLNRLSISGDALALSLSLPPPPNFAAAPLDRTTSNLSSSAASPLGSPISELLPSTSQTLAEKPAAYKEPAASSAQSQQGLPVYSQPYSQTNPNLPPPIRLPRIDSKMHQTSSRLLRMTDDDRPYTKDFKDLFSTLIVSLLPLSAHRVRLTKVEHTFLSEDAINNLGSLKFSQSNRMPDPKDPSRIVTTTTTTTFSMARDMARSICQRFLDARFIESADGKYQQLYTMKGSVWQLTPKGICILDRFCSRNGIQQKQVAELVGNSVAQLVILERDSVTDKVVSDRGSIDVVFRRFVGVNGLNVKSSLGAADADSLSDYRDGLTGVKMASERRVGGKIFKDTFTGKAGSDWLMDCSTMVDRREANETASLFVEYGLIEAVVVDRNFQVQLPGVHLYQPTRTAVYQLTTKGKDLINGVAPRGRSSESDGGSAPRGGIARDSNTQRLDKILSDPALRLLFRENLRETHCEENLSFYLDVDDFVRNCRQAIRTAQKNPGNSSMEGIKEIMAQAYGIYNAFLAPGSPCELNIDHQLRSNLASRMTKAVGQDGAMIDTLREVTSLFEDAQNAVFKLMASDSVPKFLRHPKHEQTLRNYDFDAIVVGSSRVPERSLSRSNRN